MRERWPTLSILIGLLCAPINKRVAVVGVLGMVIDLVLFQALVAVGANAELSQMASFFSGAILCFSLNARGTLAQPRQSGRKLGWALYGQLLTISLLALLLRSALLLLFADHWHWQPQA